MVNDESGEAANVTTKPGGYEFFRSALGSPRYVVAPMVDQSELAWRMLCRRYGAELCYSPMYHANLFATDPKYRKDALQTCPEDRPLIIQFCGNDAQQILEAALLAQDHCDAVDINLGCPQAIAKRGHYGSFLQDEWQLLTEIVSTLHAKLSVPVTCKIRIFEDREKTIRYAKMLEAAGCQLLTVHGRTREQKGPLTGVADWSYIKEVRQQVKIPMFANGNILGLEDVHRCLAETGVDGVMSAEGNLHNPAIFQGVSPPVWQMASEYLELVQLHPCPSSYVRGHLFKLFHHIMNLRPNSELRERLATANQLAQFQAVVQKVQAKYEPFHKGEVPYVPEEMADGSGEDVLPLAPWLCQPYIRASPESHRQKIAEKEREAEDPNRAKRQYFDKDGNEISRKRMKKLRRRQRRPNKTEAQIQLRHERRLEYCTECANPQGSKCEFRLCRVCCKERCYSTDCDCPGHGILIKSRRAKAKQFEEHVAEEDNQKGSGNPVSNLTTAVDSQDPL
ncbi:tRNA-dihydrouridine(16/17) synthase [NAD(P)(+)]-like [Drosophila ficusphila]|uniref:tRNA-dihydrouridine(16/17) synthase [NAD(P)(+)]-like n=1 Tax=Drosophila ficusphila TaxID=30025 RepID=UPI0007E89AF9|nr:tRNA-dihydrouridine(16/17) synthase [NAD(P)(+)]-like [Drosophila ficusphila]XP_017046184.1 tRNA-dihydrouridine(16/17) synthase [NAD(P)(+)]-like [Drosophila ficusphila]XP_017046185.1 tRNA-dihydrouridine(16/17) synthase [NAD(P)(+)]-like [Drosophila ficusphila]